MTADTAIGGSWREFPSTLWSQVLETRQKDADVRRSAWERLARNYWKPIYAYIRAKWAKGNEEAKDLTQDFFARMIEADLPGRADVARGRFRVYVKTALHHFMSNAERDRRSLKRGGDKPPIPLGDAWDPPDPVAGTPDESMERTWKEELIARATRLLEAECRRDGKEIHFRVFRDYYLSAAEALRHEDLAARYSISVANVNHFLKELKRAFREVLKALVAETVESPEELEEELNELFGAAPP